MTVLLPLLVVVSGCRWCCFGYECWLMIGIVGFIGTIIGGDFVGRSGGVGVGVVGCCWCSWYCRLLLVLSLFVLKTAGLLTAMAPAKLKKRGG